MLSDGEMYAGALSDTVLVSLVRRGGISSGTDAPVKPHCRSMRGRSGVKTYRQMLFFGRVPIVHCIRAAPRRNRSPILLQLGLQDLAMVLHALDV